MMDRPIDQQLVSFEDSKTRVHRPRVYSIRVALSLLLTLVTIGGYGCRSRSVEVPATVDPATERTVAQGTLVGFSTEDGAHAWRGIPFAKPPVGSLRWAAPRAPPPLKARPIFGREALPGSTSVAAAAGCRFDASRSSVDAVCR